MAASGDAWLADGPPRGAAASHGGLSVVVSDVDAHYAKAKSAGARIDSEPTDQDYGLREYGARDLENHRCWFSSHLGWRRASFR